MADRTGVVVIGGGATGCGVARDLATREIDVTLVERGSINGGTTGRSHGLLHSGARYADADPESARACREEARILRRIAGACVDDTGGYFLQLPGDSPEYFERKREACADCGIGTSVVDGETLRDREPSVAPDVERALSVPDAVVYPSRLVAATAADAAERGTTLLTDATVTDVRAGDSPAVVVEHGDGRAATIEADHVVNAAGAWAGRVAALAGVDLGMAPTRGVMAVLEHAGPAAVLNRCRPPADGDIVVPLRGHAVCGTTSAPVSDPDRFERPEREVEHVVSECAAMVPSLADAPLVRRYWGVRPLLDAGGRAATRSFHVVDHGERDGRPGLTTVVGGKLTTCRLMAEAVGDVVAERFGVAAPSLTAEEPLTGHDDPARLDELVREYGAGGPADADVVGSG